SRPRAWTSSTSSSDVPVSQAGNKRVEGRPKRARLELLVRQEDGDVFKVREIRSAIAYLRRQPPNIHDDEWEQERLPHGAQAVFPYALKNRRTELFIQTTAAEKFLWE